jgi:LynF/TruF/PatF family peptide O-prenyltransferase
VSPGEEEGIAGQRESMASGRFSVPAEEDLHMQPLLRLYAFHKQVFSIEDNSFFRLFEQLLAEPICTILECSPAISPLVSHTARFRLGYRAPNIRRGLNRIYQFLRKLAAYDQVLLNHGTLNRILDNEFDFSKIIAAGIGLDYRQQISDSKVKCYFMINNYPEKVNQVLAIHPPIDSTEDYMTYELFLFGINMHFNGRTDLEIYPHILKRDLANPKIVARLGLSDNLLSLMQPCSAMNISFEEDGKRVFHFHPENPTGFVQLLDNRPLSLIYSNVRILKYKLSSWMMDQPLSIIISLKEAEINSKKIQNINLQYALTCKS